MPLPGMTNREEEMVCQYSSFFSRGLALCTGGPRGRPFSETRKPAHFVRFQDVGRGRDGQGNGRSPPPCWAKSLNRETVQDFLTRFTPRWVSEVPIYKLR